MKKVNRISNSVLLILLAALTLIWTAGAFAEEKGDESATESEAQAREPEESARASNTKEIVLIESDDSKEPRQEVIPLNEIASDDEFDDFDYEPGKARARLVPVNYQFYQYNPKKVKSQNTEMMLSEISREAAGKVFYELKEEGEKGLTANVAVVCAVPLSDFKRETEFGRLISEYLLTDLADRGLRVTELRLGKELYILPQTGEFIMTRNIGELANNFPELEYVVMSTYTNTRKTLILQGRLVSLKDGRVKTSWRHNIPLNRELLGLFQTREKPFTIAVKGIM